MKTLSILSLLLILATNSARADEPTLPKIEHSVSVKKAYEMIPHRRTIFDFKACKIADSAEKAYLEKAFLAIEEAIRGRVISMDEYIKKAPAKASKTRLSFAEIRDYFVALEAPKGLEDYKAALVAALGAQLEFFTEWESAGKGWKYGGAKELRGHPKVKAASQSLLKAYNLLMKRYGAESAQNKQAFFDYHCSLDFI